MHSPIGGSKAHIFVNCEAFVQMTSDLPPEIPTQDARDGTAAHEICAAMIQAATVGRRLRWADFDGKAATDGTLFDEEMFDAAQIYADDVAALMRSTGVFGGPNLRIEQTIPARAIHETAFGTPDFSLYHAAGATLYVYDFKYGHRYVDAFENWQGIFYAAGLLDLMGIDGLADQLLTVEFRIVQPRAYGRGGPVRSWRVKASDLRPFVNRLEAMAEAQFKADPVATSGPHCRDCAGRFRCAAALRGGVSLFEASVQALPENPTPAALGLQLSIVKRAIEQLKALEVAYEEQVSGAIRTGAAVPGWAFEQSYGRQAWTCSVADAVAVGQSLGIDIGKPGVMTPKQAIAAGLDESIVAALTTTPRRGVKLIPDDGSHARRVFTKE